MSNVLHSSATNWPKAYGLDDDEAEKLMFASPLHDVGKVGIPDDILNKPMKLQANEWEVMKTHASIGYDILKKFQTCHYPSWRYYCP